MLYIAQTRFENDCKITREGKLFVKAMQDRENKIFTRYAEIFCDTCLAQQADKEGYTTLEIAYVVQDDRLDGRGMY